MIQLVGILVVAIGFALRFNTLLVVTMAGLVTGFVSGMSPHEVVSKFGALFVENRFMTMPVVLLLPIVAILERHGLQERAATLVRRVGAASAGTILFVYQAVRAGASTIAMNIGGHASMVRPLVVPMAEGSATIENHPLSPARSALIRSHAAAAENVGNFFADDIFVAVGPVLLIKGFFDSVGVEAGIWPIALWGAPTAVFTLVAGWWRYRALDARLARESE